MSAWIRGLVCDGLAFLFLADTFREIFEHASSDMELHDDPLKEKSQQEEGRGENQQGELCDLFHHGTFIFCESSGLGDA